MLKSRKCEALTYFQAVGISKHYQLHNENGIDQNQHNWLV